MGIVYRNKKEIPIPEGLHINHNDGRVYSLEKDDLGHKRRVVFGYATSESTMHVNDTFKVVYPDLWKQYYGDKELRPYILHSGIYAMCIGIGQTNGLYSGVQNCFGPQNGNALMDYAMYSILSRLDVTQLFEDRMSDEVLFSEKAYSDSWYSGLFNSRIDKDSIHSFKTEWLNQCREKGLKKAWVAIDGSNNDCQVSDSELADKGKAKSRKNINIVSYIYAVDSVTGMPMTYAVNDGGMVDSKAFHMICMMLKDSGIDIEGVIVDRGFCTLDVIKMIRENNYEYVLMLKSNTHGHSKMMKEHAEDIRWKASCCIGDEGLFGISGKHKIFANSSEDSYINLIFDGVNGSARSVALIKKIRYCVKELEGKISRGEKATVPGKMKKYLSIQNINGNDKVIPDYESWQSEMDTKGYHSIATSKDYGPEEANRIYSLRDACETQYMIMKSMEGFDVTRVHSDSGIESKFAACFIASIIRAEIMNACKECGYDTARMIREVDRIQLLLRADERYYPVRNYSIRQKTLLAKFGISPDSFKVIADDITYRHTSTIKTQERSVVNTDNEEKSNCESTRAEVEKRKRGRPKGSLNKKTIERMEQEKDTPPQPKRKRGRPKGSLNKKTIERMKNEKDEQPKRKPGRPIGSLNKKTIERLKREGKM